MYDYIYCKLIFSYSERDSSHTHNGLGGEDGYAEFRFLADL
jgi:hypothetical protein